jgi:DNA invertase Pin-like site-specific DNA recombinase
VVRGTTGRWNATRAALCGKLSVATLPIPFPGNTGRPRKNLDAKRILALRAQGLSWRVIAKRMRVGTGTAFRAVQKRSKSVS